MSEYISPDADKLLALVKKVGGDRNRCNLPIKFANVEDKARCSICVYKRSIPNNTHIQCAYDWLKGLEMGKVNIIPLGSSSGIGQGLYMFPVLYDPIWMMIKCQAFNTVMDEQMTLDGRKDAIVPMMAVFQLITCYSLKSKSGGIDNEGTGEETKEVVETSEAGTEVD